jgi:hypothetical protein
VWVEGGAVEEPEEELEPLLPVDGAPYDDVVLTGVAAGAGAGTAAGAGAAPDEQEDPPGDPAAAFAAMPFGRTCLVRWMTSVWTFGFGASCAVADPAWACCPSLEPSA